jgi:hypothetical protein
MVANMKRIDLLHSSRKSLEGSTTSARRAGMADAATPNTLLAQRRPRRRDPADSPDTRGAAAGD